MTGADQDSTTVLVADDETNLADLYSVWLGEEYEVRTAYGGEEALEKYDDDVDVALLDRRMPGTSGGEVLEQFREWSPSIKVGMVTAVDPSIDIIDLPADDYRVKPVTQEELKGSVKFLLELSEVDEHHRKLATMLVQRNVLQAERHDAELRGNERFERLESDITDLESTIDGPLQIPQELLER